MTDKERILSAIISRIIPGLMYSFDSEKSNYVENLILQNSKLNKGDLVFARTTMFPNDFSVGFVHEVKEKEDCVVIRKISSDKLCNYYNEGFMKINKERLGYEILEGLQYKIYRKVLKAFEYMEYGIRFKSISFDGNRCTVQARKVFTDEAIFEVSFEYSKKTTIAEIGKILEERSKND